MKTEDGTPKKDNVIDISTFRQKKAAEQEFGRGRSPLYLSHLTGKVTGGKQPSADFGERLQRIRASLEKINRLMSDLKKIGSSGDAIKKNGHPSIEKPSK